MREKLLVLICTCLWNNCKCNITQDSTDYLDFRAEPVQLHKSTDTKKLSQGRESCKNKKKSTESEIDHVFVFICLLESRFSLLSIAWMIPDPVGPHEGKPPREEESILTSLQPIRLSTLRGLELNVSPTDTCQEEAQLRETLADAKSDLFASLRHPSD